MKGVLKGIIIVMVLLGLGFALYSTGLLNNNKLDAYNVTKWNVGWVKDLNMPAQNEEIKTINGWHPADIDNPMPGEPDNTAQAWIRFQLPPLGEGTQAVLLDKVYARSIVIYIGNTKIYQSSTKKDYPTKKIIAPFQVKDQNKTIYIGLTPQNSRSGLMKDAIKVGDYEQLEKYYVKRDILDFILGGTLLLIALVMLICLLFLNYEFLTSWIALSVVILSSGLLVITYSTFLYTFYEVNIRGTQWIFDGALFALLFSISVFFEKTIGKGYYSIIPITRRIYAVYGLICFCMIIFNVANNYEYDNLYRTLTTTVTGYIMIVQSVIMVTTALVEALKGKMEAIVFSTGFILLAFTSLIELIIYFAENQKYVLVLWKFGLICFVISLIVILGRKFVKNHEQLVEYSGRLELFNNELQQSEKMEIISELAASVAHEVRNPLQVTRGFIQLMAEKHQSQDKVYLSMALEELDRASGIITDFLTFAKPEAGKATVLNVLNEFIHIEGILVPMANLQGGRISMNIPPLLQVRGNSSKFKQAFINIIKNSIEALHGHGEIHIWAYEKGNYVYIHVKDDGEGMTPSELARLGEPYFSNKSKGTGLGLMVTYSIIEVMSGVLTFKSEKGVGTEAVIRLPSVKE
ncbi:sensor histidine kinase [Paenibacillus tuaregi]|uniref:sensor histidine kinase n=1 Tax=Paenibacillus tuaregi TaxID=1816681 RepID=UPI000839138E|nr:HAMP domain-containing sensor histidine kinase [Paenibacillus tuaregi]